MEKRKEYVKAYKERWEFLSAELEKREDKSKPIPYAEPKTPEARFANTPCNKANMKQLRAKIKADRGNKTIVRGSGKSAAQIAVYNGRMQSLALVLNQVELDRTTNNAVINAVSSALKKSVPIAKSPEDENGMIVENGNDVADNEAGDFPVYQ